MNLAFFAKIFSRCALSSSSFAKISCTWGKLVNTQIKGIDLLCAGKNNVCISCVFNGFKYILPFAFSLSTHCDSLILAYHSRSIDLHKYMCFYVVAIATSVDSCIKNWKDAYLRRHRHFVKKMFWDTYKGYMDMLNLRTNVGKLEKMAFSLSSLPISKMAAKFKKNR